MLIHKGFCSCLGTLYPSLQPVIWPHGVFTGDVMLHFSEQSRNKPGAGGAVAQGAAPPASRLSYGSCSSTSEGCGGGGASQVRWQNDAQRPSTAAKILAGLGYMTLSPEAS